GLVSAAVPPVGRVLNLPQPNSRASTTARAYQRLRRAARPSARGDGSPVLLDPFEITGWMGRQSTLSMGRVLAESKCRAHPGREKGIAANAWFCVDALTPQLLQMRFAQNQLTTPGEASAHVWSEDLAPRRAQEGARI